MVTREELGVAICDMQRFIRSIMKGIPDDIDPDDVYQDIMAHVVSSCYGRFDPSKSSLKSFIGTVSRWRMLEFYRIWSKRKKTYEFNEETVAGNEYNIAPYARDVIWKLSRGLPPKQRMVVRNKADGLTEEEIGKRLGISRQAVSILLNKGIAEMRREGKDYAEV